MTALPAELTRRMRDLGLEVPGTLDGQALQTALEQLVAQLEAAREALRGMQHVYHHAAGMLALLETDGRLLDVNRTALDLIQAERDALIGQPFWLTPWWSASPDAQRELREGIVRAAGGEGVRTQAHLHLPGRHLTVEYTLVPLRRAGEVTGLLAEGRDVTEQARLTQTLAQERAFLNAVLDHMHDGVVACDGQGTLTVFNRATRELHGLPQRPLRPDDWSGAYDLFQEDGRVPLAPDQIPLYRALRGERVQDSLMVIRPAARPPVLVSTSGQALRAQDGTLLGAAVVMRDVTAEHASRAHLEHAATHDALTGLLNRAALTETLSRPGRHRSPAALLFLDLDGFKAINDTFGHPVGDEVLQVVSDRLTRNMRDRDVIARLGGDEFVVVLTAPCTPEQAQGAAERLLTGLQAPMPSSVGPLHVSASIGLVTALGDASPEALLERADQVMYQAKRAGKNRVVLES